MQRTPAQRWLRRKMRRYVGSVGVGWADCVDESTAGTLRALYRLAQRQRVMVDGELVAYPSSVPLAQMAHNASPELGAVVFVLCRSLGEPLGVVRNRTRELLGRWEIVAGDPALLVRREIAIADRLAAAALMAALAAQLLLPPAMVRRLLPPAHGPPRSLTENHAPNVGVPAPPAAVATGERGSCAT